DTTHQLQGGEGSEILTWTQLSPWTLKPTQNLSMNYRQPGKNPPSFGMVRVPTKTQKHQQCAPNCTPTHQSPQSCPSTNSHCSLAANVRTCGAPLKRPSLQYLLTPEDVSLHARKSNIFR
ncbi:hypothetical protein ATANTOWER_019498, partial [Ataeniobius toweri]|nr:hypothetical protein [Ataeniobius toweri]